MRNGFVYALAFVAALSAGAATARAQNQAGRGAGAARPAAPAAPSAPAPVRDLSGVWAQKRVATGINVGNLNTWGNGDAPMTPWGQEQFKSAKSSNSGDFTLAETNDPVISKCQPPGVPRIFLQPFPMQIVQTPTQVILLFEYDHTVRHIYIDGRKHPDDPTPSYMGHSIGHWEGNDTLVVDTVGFNDKTWLDRAGHAHSDQLHVIERFKRTDRDTIQIDITMEDAKALTKPWQVQAYYTLKPDWDIQELVCVDNNDFVEK
jgi:hypothetical protein